MWPRPSPLSSRQPRNDADRTSAAACCIFVQARIDSGTLATAPPLGWAALARHRRVAMVDGTLVVTRAGKMGGGAAACRGDG
jgi:hypothetical protein